MRGVDLVKKMCYNKHKGDEYMLISAILAGAAIAIGAIANLVVGPPLGPFLFTIGLLMVLSLKLDLFPGKAGLLVTREFSLFNLLLVWFGNFCGCFVMGYAVLFAFPEENRVKIVEGAQRIMNARAGSEWYTLVTMGILCGLLMYVAV